MCVRLEGTPHLTGANKASVGCGGGAPTCSALSSTTCNLLTDEFDIFDEVWSPFAGDASTPRRVPGEEVVGETSAQHTAQHVHGPQSVQRCLFSFSSNSATEATAPEQPKAFKPLPRLIVPARPPCRALQLATTLVAIAPAHPVIMASAPARQQHTTHVQQGVQAWLQDMETGLAAGGSNRCRRVSGDATPCADDGVQLHGPASASAAAAAGARGTSTLPPPAFVLLGLLA